MNTHDLTLRIIGGNWRSRKVSFPNRPGLRPTPDRVRETLFNWLQFDVAGARCLELYAGSGALGMEALSRGAAQVTFVESDQVSVAAIEANLTRLKADPATYQTVHGRAEAYIEAFSEAPFDLIFLDPPYKENNVVPILSQICEAGMLSPEGKCYIESGATMDPAGLPGTLTLSRQKRAGQVQYCLVEPSLRQNR
ncbi:MAG: 16S rRNA (guanine(966)-N(2))-methyltransferase RsmD [Pseudomonadales bacterium]